MATETRLALWTSAAAFRLSTALLLVSSTLACAHGAPAVDADSRIQQLIAAISETRLRQLDTTLVSFGTRETLSAPSPTRGVTAGPAHEQQRGVKRDPALGKHARQLHGQHRVGEEQGLIGSSAHAERLAREHVTVEALFNNDIVGNSRGGNGVVDTASVKVYSLGPEDSMSRSLARYIARSAAVYVPSHRIRLMAMEDRFRRGSDHSSFTRRGFPAVVFREANENFARQHSVADTLDGVDFAYLGQNARVNAAGAASLALAPPAPDVAGPNGVPRLARGASGYDAELQWKASPGAVAYRVYWRSGWSLDWEHTQTVGNVTRFVLPNVSIDDYVFGVAALGADGHESLIRAVPGRPACRGRGEAREIDEWIRKAYPQNTRCPLLSNAAATAPSAASASFRVESGPTFTIKSQRNFSP